MVGASAAEHRRSCNLRLERICPMTSHPSHSPVSALRERMIEDMTVRGFGAKTRHDYVRHVRTFSAFIGRSPDTATAEEMRRFQLHQSETGVGAPSINSAVSALRFLFTVTLERPDLARRLTVVRQPRKLPLVLSAQEVALLLEAAPGPKYQAALATAYGAGLRVAEVVAQGRRRRQLAHDVAGRAGHDSRHHLKLAEAHMPHIGSAPVGSVAIEDVGDLEPRAAHRRRLRPPVSASPWRAAGAGRGG